jgi:hypothetical protein
MATKKIGLIAVVIYTWHSAFQGIRFCNSIYYNLFRQKPRGPKHLGPFPFLFDLSVSNTYDLQRWIVSFCDERGQASSHNDARATIKVLFSQHESHSHASVPTPSAQIRTSPVQNPCQNLEAAMTRNYSYQRQSRSKVNRATRQKIQRSFQTDV